MEELWAGYQGKGRAKQSFTIMGQIPRIKQWRSIGSAHFAHAGVRTDVFWVNDTFFTDVIISFGCTNPIFQKDGYIAYERFFQFPFGFKNHTARHDRNRGVRGNHDHNNIFMFCCEPQRRIKPGTPGTVSPGT